MRNANDISDLYGSHLSFYGAKLQRVEEAGYSQRQALPPYMIQL